MKTSAPIQRPVLVLGLVVPGGGSLARGRIGEGLTTAWCVAFLLTTAGIALVMANIGAVPGGLHLVQALADLPSRPNVPPTVPVLVLLALGVHVMAAWGAARCPEPSGRTSRPQ